MTDLQDLDIAIVHGNYVGRGGGEQVAEELARTFDAPLYYGLGHEKYEANDVDTRSLFNDKRLASRLTDIYELRDLYYIKAFRHVEELHDYDVLIQSGNEMGWYVPPDGQLIVKYTHSTPRNIYDQYPENAGEGNIISRAIFGAYTFTARHLYDVALSYPEVYVANSEVIERRIDKYWDKQPPDVCVVYPPVDVNELGNEHANETPIDAEYYLALDRIEPNKNIERIVEAFEGTEQKLVVAGDGSLRDGLEKRTASNDNIQFLGYVSEEKKRALLAGAKSLVYAAEDEDFGIVPIEAFASGTPVIGPREGFTQYQIESGVNGLLYDSDVETLRETVIRFEDEGVSAPPHVLEQFADQFSKSEFREKMVKAVEKAVQQTDIDVAFRKPSELMTEVEV